jgi:hypothetical protein
MLAMTSKTPGSDIRPTLRDVISKAIVVAYKEDVSSLVSSLAAEGFDVEVLRTGYTDEEMTYSSQSRTFLSHRNAWRKAIDITGYTLICEADFVPCRGIGGFKVFWPWENTYSWGYLYQGSPRLLAMLGSEGFLRGHAAPMVCYVVNQTVACLMLQFFENQRENYNFRAYFTFEAHLQWYVTGFGAQAFIPLHHYGEHGGLPNPEHASFGALSREGRHRADNLKSSLHFLPLYARGSYLSFFRVRLAAHLLGFGRLLAGRWIIETNVYHLRRIDMLKMYLIGFRRLISWPL